MNHPDYVYRPHSDERRLRASALAKRKLGAPPGHSTIYGVHVPDEHAPRIRMAAQKIAAKIDYAAAASFVGAQKMAGFQGEIKREWSPQEDAALRRHHYAGHTAAAIAKMTGRTRNSIIGRRYRLKLRSPPAGCRIMPVAEARKLVADHLREAPGSQNVTDGLVVVAPMFICATPRNIAAYTGIACELVRAMWQRLVAGGVWNDDGPIDRDRYMREGDEAAILLVLDILLAQGRLKRTLDAHGEELWSAT